MKETTIANSALFNRKGRSHKSTKCPLDGKVLDYKNVDLLKQFVSEKGRILPSRISGVCAHNQRLLKKAVKRARFLALLPFAAQ